jgi:flavin-binding protein dodecin
MSVMKIIEINASSPKSFEDAIQEGFKRTEKTLQDISFAKIKKQYVTIEDNKVKEFHVVMKVNFTVHE